MEGLEEAVEVHGRQVGRKATQQPKGLLVIDVSSSAGASSRDRDPLGRTHLSPDGRILTLESEGKALHRLRVSQNLAHLVHRQSVQAPERKVGFVGALREQRGLDDWREEREEGWEYCGSEL